MCVSWCNGALLRRTEWIILRLLPEGLRLVGGGAQKRRVQTAEGSSVEGGASGRGPAGEGITCLGVCRVPEVA